MILRTVVEVEADTQCEHVFALDHRFVVQTGIRQSRLGHLRNVRNDHVEIFQVQLPDRVERCETRFPKVLFGNGVLVEDYRCTRLEPFAVRLQCRRVHCDQYVAEVARVELSFGSEVHLESGYTRYGTLRGADFGGIVGECRDSVAEQG